MASIIYSHKKILQNFQLKECQTRLRRSDNNDTSLFPLTSIKQTDDGLFLRKKNQMRVKVTLKGKEKTLDGSKITLHSTLESKQNQDDINQSTMQCSSLVSKQSKSQASLNKILKLEDSILSHNLSMEYPHQMIHTQEGAQRSNLNDSVLEKINMVDSKDDINNISAIHPPNSAEKLGEKSIKKLVLPQILNYKEYLQKKQSHSITNSSETKYETTPSIIKESQVSIESCQSNTKRIRKPQKILSDFLVKNDKMMKRYFEGEEDYTNIKTYLSKQPLRNSANLLPNISQNQYLSNKELFTFKNLRVRNEPYQRKHRDTIVGEKLTQLTNKNNYLIDQYLVKLNHQNEAIDQHKKQVDKFFSNISHQKKQEEDQQKKILILKPKVIEKGIIEAYYHMNEHQKQKLKRIYRGLDLIMKYIEQLCNTDHNKKKHIKLLKKLSFNKKNIYGIFLNEREDDFVVPFNLDSFEKKIIFKETSIVNKNEIVIEDKYNLTIMRDIEELVFRINEHSLAQKLSVIDEIEGNIVMKEQKILGKAKILEIQNNLDPCFFAYNCLKQLSSESIAMLQNNDLSTSLLEAVKGDHSFPKYFQDENLHFYNKISKSINKLHRQQIEARKNIFYFK